MSTRISVAAFVLIATGPVGAAQQPAAPPPPAANTAAASNHTEAAIPPGYVIGTQDVLSIVFWRDRDMSADVVVRPDGKISLPLLNEMQAAGYTPEQLREKITEAAAKYLEEPNSTVVVKEIHSRNVFITGSVARPGSFPLIGEMNVLQLIAQAGGLQEYADSKKIVVIRTENGQPQYHPFNYNDVVKRKNVQQNIVLKPGDTVVVP